MTGGGPFDLVVVGADCPGLAAAACAAAAGARVMVVKTGHEISGDRAAPGAPNFVWRRLDLHRSGLKESAVSARISLFDGGRRISNFESARKNEQALSADYPEASALWAEFADAASSRRAGWSDGSEYPSTVFDRFAELQGLGPRPGASAVDMLDDFFVDDDLKTHLAHLSLAPFGRAGDEAGSAEALSLLVDDGAWPVRADPAGPTLEQVLKDACNAHGVEMPDVKMRGVAIEGGKISIVELVNGDRFKAKAVIASSVRLARSAGFDPQTVFSPLERATGARALLRIKLNEKATIEGGLKDAIYYASASCDELRQAREAVLEGRIPESPPVTFELRGDEILAEAPYCPQSLIDEEGERPWTQQDQKAYGNLLATRVMKFIDQPASAIRMIDVEIDGKARVDDEPGALKKTPLQAPAPSVDEIGAAALMALKVIGHE